VKQLNIVRYENTVRSAVFNNETVVEVVIESADRIGSTHDCSVNDWVVILVGWNHARSGSRINYFRNIWAA
jgi:hypothetical protein